MKTTIAEADKGRKRAWTCFALECLAEDPHVRPKTVYALADATMNVLDELDGMNIKLNTRMDRAVHDVMQSNARTIFRRRLVQGFIRASEDRRNYIGRVLARTVDVEQLKERGVSKALTPIVKRLSRTIRSGSYPRRVDAALQLLDVFYIPQGIDSTARIDFLPLELLHEVKDGLLAAGEERSDESDALSVAALWALVWLTSVPCPEPGKAYQLTRSERDRLRKIVLDEGRDSFVRSRAALFLGCGDGWKPVIVQADWVYQWALVADGNAAQQNLPKPQQADSSEDIDALKRLITSPTSPRSKKNVAIALGRLGCFVSEMVLPLLDIFKSDLATNSDRDEALVYLVLVGGENIAQTLVEEANQARKDTDSYDLPSRSFLALIGLGNVAVLKRQLESGEGDLNSYAYALAGVEDPEGRNALHSLKHHSNGKVQEAASKALVKAQRWGLLPA